MTTKTGSRRRLEANQAALQLVPANDQPSPPQPDESPEERELWTSDPRGGDLPEDSELWEQLLDWSYDIDARVPYGLFGALHGLRCLGARLQWTLWGFRLVPGEISRSEYLALRRRYLIPWASTLESLLARLGAAYPGTTLSA
jgi:hypothetical protein